MKDRKNPGEILYLSAYALWMFVAVLKLTYFKEMLPISEVSRDVQTVVILLLLVKLMGDFTFSLGRVVELWVWILFLFVAWSGGRLSFAVSLALIYSARNVSFEKILKCTLVLQVLFFIVTVTCSQTGILEDYIWNVGTRDRHGLGYTHSLLGSHFVLFMSLILVVLLGKITLWASALILLANYFMYVYTDARTTILLSGVFVFMAWIARALEKKRKPLRTISLPVATVPFWFFGISIWSTCSFTWDSPKWTWLNLVFSGRFWLAKQAWNEYGITWFGQKIKWVGESTLKAGDGSLVYNYVDNAYMQSFFNYGILFVFLLCLGFGLVLYRSMQSGRYLMAVVIFVILAHGFINPQLTELAYNPFLLLLGEAFIPPAKQKNQEERTGI